MPFGGQNRGIWSQMGPNLGPKPPIRDDADQDPLDGELRGVGAWGPGAYNPSQQEGTNQAKRFRIRPKWDRFGGSWVRTDPLGSGFGPYPDPFLADSVSQRPSRARARYIIGDTLSPIYLSMLGPHGPRTPTPRGPDPGLRTCLGLSMGRDRPRPKAVGLGPTPEGCEHRRVLRRVFTLRRMGRSPNKQRGARRRPPETKRSTVTRARTVAARVLRLVLLAEAGPRYFSRLQATHVPPPCFNNGRCACTLAWCALSGQHQASPLRSTNHEGLRSSACGRSVSDLERSERPRSRPPDLPGPLPGSGPTQAKALQAKAKGPAPEGWEHQEGAPQGEYPAEDGTESQQTTAQHQPRGLRSVRA